MSLKPHFLSFLMSSSLVLALTACSTVSLNLESLRSSEAASAITEKTGWQTRKYAVAAANPLATEAGLIALRAGGSAIDAAIAVQMVLGLVEPQSSGVAGGAFILHHNGRVLEAYDGRETAPAAADENLFIKDGKPMPFYEAVVGGRAVGTPGVMRALELAHREHGRLPWAQLFAPAIELAENGFQVSQRLNTLLQNEQHLRKDARAAAYFYSSDGKPREIGFLLKNPAYAELMRRLASQGSRALHEGVVAQSIVTAVREHPSNPGLLSLSDLAGYQAKKRTPICMEYPAQKALRICGMPPPSSGMIAVGQILGILSASNAGLPAQALKLSESGQPSADWLHQYLEASRLAFADRAQYLGDPDFIAAPDGKIGGDWQVLLRPDYLADRARLIGTNSMKGNAKPGQPSVQKSAYGMSRAQEEYGTSHISIVDAFGNALSMTTTIEDQFGARLMVNPFASGDRPLAGGFLLNNELTDFNFAPRDAQDLPTANRVQAGKRPRSSMSPTLVFDQSSGELVASLGSPGGALIIHYTAKTLYGMFNWGLNAQQAINLPNFGAAAAPSLLEEKRFEKSTVEALQTRGHEVREQAMTSGLQAIGKNASGWFGGADPRREGVVRGD